MSAQRRDGVPEQITITQTMKKNGKGTLKSPKVTVTYRVDLRFPMYM